MTNEEPLADTASPDFELLVQQFADEWRAGHRAGAAQWLSDHAELPDDQSLVLDLALEEYHQRQNLGELVDVEEFCRQFSHHGTAVGRLLSVHRLVQENPALFAAARLPHWPAVGEEFQGCLLLEELGRGAFSRVYLARETALGDRLVAVKVTELGSAEAVLLGKLEHPNIVPIHAAKPDPATGLIALIMAYRGHATLADLVDAVAAQDQIPTKDSILRDVAGARRPAQVPATSVFATKATARPYVDGVLDLAAQLADGLAFMHAQGVQHQDLKPSNILLDTDGKPRLLDFNLAYDERDAQSKRGGTLPYMAPERLTHLANGVVEPTDCPDPRTDLFSLGAILYETLTGRHPFDAHALLRRRLTLPEMAAELIARQRNGAKPLHLTRLEVDPGLGKLICRCLAWDIADRPASADAVAAELRRLARPAYRGRRLLRRKRTAVRVLLAVIMACAVAGAAWAANRPSWEQREFDRGVSELGLGRPAAAEVHFSNARQAEPNALNATLGWAISLQRQGKHEEAFIAFTSLPHPNAWCYLGAGYCANLRQMPAEAVICYQRAIELGGGCVAAWNNLGYSHQQLSHGLQAQDCYAKAIKLDSEAMQPYYNRAISALIDARDNHRVLPDQARSDLQRAIELEPHSAELHIYTARFLYLEDQPTGEARAHALDHLESALALGADPSKLGSEEFLRPLQGEKRFAELAARPVPETPAMLPARLIDPLANDPF